MLFAYQQQTQLLCSDIKQEALNPFDLRTYINIARAQLAGDAECIRLQPTIQTQANERYYLFGAAVFFPNDPTQTGVAGVLAIRDIGREIPGGSAGIVKLFGRPWEWLNTFKIQVPAPIIGVPTRWATFQPGANGIFGVDPIPDGAYTLVIDAVCYPIPLIDDTTVEALRYPWTDAVPYYAAYLAYLSQRQAEPAAGMFEQYRLFARRGTQITTPTQLPDNFSGGAGAQQAMDRSLVGGPAERAAR